jgi:hypothetical protein
MVVAPSEEEEELLKSNVSLFIQNIIFYVSLLILLAVRDRCSPLPAVDVMIMLAAANRRLIECL